MGWKSIVPALLAALGLLHLPSVLPTRSLRLPILEYHRIGAVRPTLPLITQRLTVDPRQFAAEMGWLVRNGYHAVTDLQAFDALEHGAELPPKPVMITFDDGYRDVLWNAAPVLHRLHLHATEFVITGRISGSDSTFLTWGELGRLEQLGVQIGSHTITHADLPSLPPAEALHELIGARLAIERHLGVDAQWIAYPFGRFDSAVVRLTRRAGYVL